MRFLIPDTAEPVTEEMEGSEIWDCKLGFDALMLTRMESEAGIFTDGFDPLMFLINELPIKNLLAWHKNTFPFYRKKNDLGKKTMSRDAFVFNLNGQRQKKGHPKRDVL